MAWSHQGHLAWDYVCFCLRPSYTEVDQAEAQVEMEKIWSERGGWACLTPVIYDQECALDYFYAICIFFIFLLFW